MRESAEAKRFVEGVRKNLREMRKARGLTQEALARKLQTDVPTISRTETGNRDPRCFELYEFARALGVTPPALVTVADPADGRRVVRRSHRKSPSHSP